MTWKAGLVSTNGTRIALKSVHIEGQVDGLTAEMTIIQRYRNESGNKLEIVYTFPLASGAVLLGMEVSLGGRRLHGSIAEKKEAWKRYEEAIDDGDAPVLVEQPSPGLYTANLGNINAGEDVTVELRYAQLLRFDNGSLRLTIPTVIAERYGDEHGAGRLATHESAAANIVAEYPLTLRVLLFGQLAQAEIHCPSHRCNYEKTPDGQVVSLDSGAILDRDFILCLDDLEQRPCAQFGTDDDLFLMLASFCPGPSGNKTIPLRLKILADCSGSMAGDSIEQTRQALFGLLGLLERGDYVSHSRFGSTVRHETNGFLAHSPDAMTQLSNAFRQTEADMGGTEMPRALFSTLSNISMPEDGQVAPCVLLITDGAIWDVDGVIRTCRATGQRIFAIGVGSAPAESLLRELALQTGGAYHLVSPNENITQTVKNMIGRMREPAYGSPFVDWGDEPVWQTALPSHLYGGETAHVFASFDKLPTSAPTLHWRTEGEKHALSVEKPRMARNKALARLAGALRLAAAGSPKEARELALQYQLVSEHTSLFLVHAQEGGKCGELPVLHQIPQMMAAGHSGFGTTVASPAKKPRLEGLGAGPASFAPLSESSRSKDLKKDYQPLAPKDPAIKIGPLDECTSYPVGRMASLGLSVFTRNEEFIKDFLPLASSVPVIKVIGVGGGGSYAVEHMVSSGLKEVTFIAANTDAQALTFARADHTIHLDSEIIDGKNGPVRQVAEESLASVKDAIGEAHLVFVVAGMGGNTGSGASPAIANVVRKTGALTVGIVTTPMSFEGKKRVEAAEAGIAELRRRVDFLIIIPIDRLYQTVPKQTNLRDLFKIADATMHTAVRCISDALTQQGSVDRNLFKMASLLAAADLAAMGSGSASGEKRARDAARQALASPLLEYSPSAEAHGALITIIAGSDLSREEVDGVKGIFMNALHENATILISTVLDESLADEVRVTFIATTA